MNVIPPYVCENEGHTAMIYNTFVFKKKTIRSTPLFWYWFTCFFFEYNIDTVCVCVVFHFLKCGCYGADTNKSRWCGHIIGVGRNHSVLVLVPIKSANCCALLQIHVNGERIAANYQHDGVASSGDKRHRQTAIKIVRPSIIDLILKLLF